jgi:hypothetical protein
MNVEIAKWARAGVTFARTGGFNRCGLLPTSVRIRNRWLSSTGNNLSGPNEALTVWRGEQNVTLPSDGAGYNPSTNSWTATNTTNATGVQKSKEFAPASGGRRG